MRLYTLAALRLALPLALLAGCTKHGHEPAATGSVALEMEAKAGTAPLVLGTQTYTKADGQSFTVSKFKYLLSNVKLLRADGSAYAVPDGYYLVDAQRPTTSRIVIDKVPLGTYTGLSFVVGVDAARNNAAFQSGGLNHGNDLYWEWSAEYVFMKLDGTSAQAPTGRALTFHIGGNNCARVVSPAFGSRSLAVEAGHVPTVHMNVNVNAMFNSTDPAKEVKFNQVYSVESGHSWAPIVADNYAAGMFSVRQIMVH